MFKGLDEKQLKKIHAIEKKITFIKELPHNKVVDEAKKELEELFEGEGRVNPTYAQETIIGLEYAKKVFHYESGKTLLHDVKSEKSIRFRDYE